MDRALSVCPASGRAAQQPAGTQARTEIRGRPGPQPPSNHHKSRPDVYLRPWGGQPALRQPGQAAQPGTALFRSASFRFVPVRWDPVPDPRPGWNGMAGGSRAGTGEFPGGYRWADSQRPARPARRHLGIAAIAAAAAVYGTVLLVPAAPGRGADRGPAGGYGSRAGGRGRPGPRHWPPGAHRPRPRQRPRAGHRRCGCPVHDRRRPGHHPWGSAAGQPLLHGQRGGQPRWTWS